MQHIEIFAIFHNVHTFLTFKPETDRSHSDWLFKGEFQLFKNSRAISCFLNITVQHHFPISRFQRTLPNTACHVTGFTLIKFIRKISINNINKYMYR